MASVRFGQDEVEDYSRHRTATRNMLADLQSLGVPGKRLSSKKSAAGQRLESLRHSSTQPHAEGRQVVDQPLRPKDIRASPVVSINGASLENGSKGPASPSGGSGVTLPPVSDSSATHDGVPPALARSTSSGEVCTPPHLHTPRTCSTRMSIQSRSVADLQITLDLRGDGDFTLSGSNFTHSSSLPELTQAPTERVKRPALHRRKTDVMHETITVMTRDAAESGKDVEKEDRDRLCSILRKVGKGSLLRGWRSQLDENGKLEVDWEDYIRAAESLKYSGDPRFLFCNEQHTLHLRDLSPDDFRRLEKFKHWVRETLGGPAQLFQALLPNAHSREVEMNRFCSVCRDRGFDSDLDSLQDIFYCCDFNEYGAIKWEDCIFLETDPKLRTRELYRVKVGQLMLWKQLAANEYIAYKKDLAEKKAERKGIQGQGSVSPKHRLAPRAWNADTFERMPAVVAHAHHQRHVEAVLKARVAKKAFKKHLCENYGNEVRAIRRGLSSDGYSFGSQTLRCYVRRLNLPIEPADLWAALDADKDSQVTLEELCPRSALILASFQQWARDDPCLGSCVAIWQTPEAAEIARKRTGTWYRGKKMLNSVFLETLKELGWPRGQDEKARSVLIGSLDVMDCGLISLSDLEWLDKWRPVEWVYADPDPAAWVEIKELLQEKYDHPLRAWRAILDADDSNHVDWPEFKRACQKLKFRGNVAGAWRELDADLHGIISMKQYDLESASLLASFKEWAEATFGSISNCFKSLDLDSNGLLTLNELKRACGKFHWEGDVQLLFKCLDVDRARDIRTHGKLSISLQEIGFLDHWYIEISEEELKRYERKFREPKRKAVCPSKRIDAITARLAGGPPPDMDLPPSPSMKASPLSMAGVAKLARAKSSALSLDSERGASESPSSPGSSHLSLKIVSDMKLMARHKSGVAFSAKTFSETKPWMKHVEDMDSSVVGLPQVHSSAPALLPSNKMAVTQQNWRSTV